MQICLNAKTFQKMKGSFFYLSIGLLFSGMLLSACSAPLKITKTTSQLWHGGVEGAGSGKNYIVYATKGKSVEVVFDKVWIGDNEKGWLPSFNIAPLPDQKSLRNVAAKGIQSFKLHFSETFPGPKPNLPNTVTPLEKAPNDLPANFDKGVAVFYHIGTKKGIWVLSDIEQLPTLNYP